MSRVIAASCFHCPAMHPKFPQFLSDIKSQWSCDRVVILGDVVDWAAISYHEKDPRMPSPQEEMEAAKRQVKELKKAIGDDAEWLIGNHDCLNQRKAKTAGILPSLIRSYNEIWQVGWNVTERYGFVEIDGVIYNHGEVGSQRQFAGLHNAVANFQSYVQGHLHSEAGVWWRANKSERVFGMNVGCGMDADTLAASYGAKFSKKPVNGCGIVIDGEFAYFEPMN